MWKPNFKTIPFTITAEKIKYFGYQHVRDLYDQNYKMSKEATEDLNKWETYCIRGLKVSTQERCRFLPKLFCSFNAILSKSQEGFSQTQSRLF